MSFWDGLDLVTATVSRGGGDDRHGDPIPGTTHTITGVVFPRTSSESEVQADTVISGFTFLGPASNDLRSTDTLTFNADVADPKTVWQVEGEAGPWVDPFAGEKVDGIQAAISKASG